MKAAAVARSSALGPTLLLLLSTLLLSTLLLPAVLACEPRKHNFGKREEGSGSEISLNDQGSAAAIAAYKCDPSSCKLPSCRCAGTDAPGDLKPDETPQFIVFTADDAIQGYTTGAVNSLLAQRRNPNNCSIKMTYYTSLSYTNYSQVTEWYMLGNEIADHTMTHVGQATSSEINGNLIALNALAGIPLGDIKGFRAPYLNYTTQTLKDLKSAGFLYDSSAATSARANASMTDAFWPYTLDNGLLNDCSKPGNCYGEPAIPGLWEIPMYASFDSSAVHLMDPYLDSTDTDFVLQFLKDTFSSHYNGKRQPFGLYTHPIHLATGYPGVDDPIAQIKVVNDFLDWAQAQNNVWIVSSEQLLDWVLDPKSISQLDQSDALKCSAPTLAADLKICNGVPGHQDGLLLQCPFDYPFQTCYGCPKEMPSPGNPNPEQVTVKDNPLRIRLPSNCATAFWDPVAGSCLPDGAVADITRPIGPNGANLTGGGTGTSQTTSSTSSRPTSYTPFSGASGGLGLPHLCAVLSVASLGMLAGGGALLI